MMRPGLEEVRLHKLLVSMSLALAAISWPAVAAYHDGKDLLQDCVSSSEIEKIYCLGYVVGIADAMDLGRSRNNKPACIPKGVKPSEIRGVVIKTMQDHPEAQSKDAAELVFYAIRQNWKCQ
jgi:hypothetical protein